MLNECLLTTLPGSNPQEQVVVILVNDPETGSRISLRHQSWGEGIGWYTQKTIDLEPGQVQQLRSALGLGGARMGGLGAANTPETGSVKYSAGRRAAKHREIPSYLRVAQVESA